MSEELRAAVERSPLARELERAKALLVRPEAPRERMPAAIAAGLVKAVRESAAVPKDAYNKHHQYSYASSESVLAESRAALAAAGLVVVTEAWRLEAGVGEPETVVDDTGRESIVHPPDRIVVQYLIVHESGEQWRPGEVSIAAIPGKGRPEDKAESAALTLLLGYFLRSLLLLPRVDSSEDVQSRDDSEHQPRRQQSRGGQSSGTENMKIGFGKGAGKKLTEASPEELRAYREMCAKKLDDPQWGKRNRATVAAIDAILNRAPADGNDHFVEQMQKHAARGRNGGAPPADDQPPLESYRDE